MHNKLCAYQGCYSLYIAIFLIYWKIFHFINIHSHFILIIFSLTNIFAWVTRNIILFFFLIPTLTNCSNSDHYHYHIIKNNGNQISKKMKNQNLFKFPYFRFSMDLVRIFEVNFLLAFVLIFSNFEILKCKNLKLRLRGFKLKSPQQLRIFALPSDQLNSRLHSPIILLNT